MISYKEHLLFVASCLTLDNNPERVTEIREIIQNEEIQWEKIVKISSGQFVLPAMYLQLKRNDLLTELPDDLTEYLVEITNLNRERNIAILEQVKEVTDLLNKHNIAPVFLKGVAHLLDGLYIDIAERMIGDIDFLVPENEMEKAANILIAIGYKPISKYTKKNEHRHYPTLQNFNYSAAIEIHKEVLIYKRRKLLRGYELLKDKKPVKQFDLKAFIPSIDYQIIHNVYNAKVNDSDTMYGDISLRPMYDLYLLALNNDIMKVAKEHGKKINLFNTYFAAISIVFSNTTCINFQRTIQTFFFQKRLNLLLNHPLLASYSNTLMYLYARTIRYITLPIQAIFYKDERKLLFHILSTPERYRKHFSSYVDFFKRR